DEEGKIFTERGEVAQLGLVRFERPQQLERRGDGLLATTETPLPVEPGAARVVQGALERANVNPIVEMTRMIKILRSYQEMQRALDRSRETEQRAIDRLPRVQA
ncbi:MAG: flagellar basal-body rod protein FlgF, partial [Alphaproteobacteria bacterium]